MKVSIALHETGVHCHNRSCFGVFTCHLLQYCGINCRCPWIKCISTNHRSGWIANRTSQHAISRATRAEDRVIHKKDTLDEQRPQPRTLCAQHKCRPQGGGQRTTALVADLITVDVQDRQRRIGLVKIERSCHGVAWSTHLTDVDHHVSAMTLDAKLIELLHFMPCPACRGHCRHGKRTSKVVLLCHVMA